MHYEREFDDSGKCNLISFTTDVENSESIIPTGQSGNVMSPFYANQADKYVTGKYRKQRMNKSDIEANKTGEAFINSIK